MQVATLFRETATLLGAATMEPASGQAACNSPKEHRLKLAAEPHDDGYETSADLMLIKSHDIKCEPLDDPYSFVDDEPAVSVPLPVPVMPHGIYTTDTSGTLPDNGLVPVPRKRGRKKKIKLEPGQEFNAVLTGMPQPPIKERKKHDRFNGMPEEEVSKRTLPDHLTYNLDIIIIGINPGLFAAYKGHHYAGPGNHFWKCLYLSGLTPEQMTADEDYKLLQVGIGFTNMVQRATKGSADLTRKEIKEGSQILLEKLRRFKPKIAVFNGKLIYEVFSGKKDFSFGRQPDLIEGTNTYMWVMPSSSARCAQLPRAADKVPFYAALKKFRDYLNGMVASIDDSEVVFSDTKINKPCYESEFKSEYPSDIMDISNATVKKEDANGVFCKKKRGRPKKIRVEGEEPVKPVRRPANPNANLNSDGTKKKRGRPKKIKAEDKPPELEQTDSSTTVREHFSSPSQSPATFCTYAQPCAAYAQSPRPVSRAAYAQSPRPQSQPLTHSDLSSEISAAISSPAPTSPPPDFEPPASMPPEDSTECCFSSPAPSEPQYPQYNYGRPQDIAAKSLSGLESLVDQIPSIAEGGGGGGNGSEAGCPNDAPADTYPPYHYGYGHYNYNYPGLFEHQACVPLAYPSYAQYGSAGGYGGTPHNAPPAPLHAPSPNYPPYYNSHAAYQPVAAPATPATASYHMFDRIKPDSGYGGF